MFKLRHFFYAFFVWLLCFCIVTAFIIIEAKHTTASSFQVVSKNDSAKFSLYGITHKNEMLILSNNYYVTDYIIAGDTAQLKSITSNVISNWNNAYLKKVALSNCTNVHPDLVNNKNIFSFSTAINTNYSYLPKVNQYLNWNGDGNLVVKILLHPLMLLITLLLLVYKKCFAYYKKTRFVEAPTFSNVWLYALVMAVLLVMLIIVVNNNTYFNQDDNYAQFTPVMLQGLNDWYNNGNIPTYNPYQYCGVPTTEFSTYAFFYPLTHLSYIIATYIFNKPVLFVTIFIIIHFMIAAFFMLKVMQHYKVHLAYAIAASFGFIFCGFNVEVARAWYFVMPALGFTPFLFWLVLNTLHLQQPVKWYVHLLAGILIAMFAYGGNMQFWVYTIGLLIVFWFFLAPFNLFKKIKIIAPSLCIALVLVMPQLIMSMQATKGLQRNSINGEGILNGLGSLILPFIFNEKKTAFWGTDELKESSKYFYYGPSLFVAIALIVLLLFVLSQFKKNFFNNAHTHLKVIIVLLAIALLFSFGRFGVLWIITSKLPLINNFRMPFKFLFYVQFFGVIAGALLLQQLQLKFKNILATVSVSVTIIVLYNIKDTFYVYANGNNKYNQYSFLQKIKNDNNYRIMSLGPLRSFHADYDKSLTNNLPTQYGIASAEGYEPLFDYKSDNLKNTNQLAIKYFVVAKLPITKFYFWGDAPLTSQYLSKPNVELIYTDSIVSVYQNNNAQPIVAAYHNDTLLINKPTITNHNNGVYIQYTQPINATKIVLAYNYLPQLSIYINNKKVNATKDVHNRIVINVTEPVLSIRSKYTPFPF
jgi:hypothetical protein